MPTFTTQTFPLDLIGIDDRQLDHAIDQADAAANAATLRTRLVHEKKRRHDEQITRAQERATLIAKLSQQRDSYRARAIDLCTTLDQTPPIEQYPLAVEAVTTFQQWYALGTAIAGVQNERLHAYWDGLDLVRQHAPAAADLIWRRNGARLPKLTPAQMPWQADLARLKTLSGLLPTKLHTQPRIGNGG